jgi:hypothetical protein
MKNVLSTIVAVSVLASVGFGADRRAAPATGGGSKGISESSAASLGGLSKAVTGSLTGSSEFVSKLGDVVSEAGKASGQSITSAAVHSFEAVVTGLEWSADGSRALVNLASELGTFSIEVSKASYEVSKQAYDVVEDSVKAAGRFSDDALHASGRASEDSLKASWQVGKTVVITIIDAAGIVSVASSKAAQFTSENVIAPSMESSGKVSVALLEVSGAIIMAPVRLVKELVSLGKSKNTPAPTTPVRR